MWLNGGYSDDKSIDSTAQRQAKARAMAQAAYDLMERIENIRSCRMEENENGTASGGLYLNS
jgi:hypothetical protein